MQNIFDRKKTLDFLDRVKQKVHWKTESLITSLSDYWEEVDSVGNNCL